MAGDRTNSGTPEQELPELSGALRPPDPQQLRGTLAYDLVSVVDDIRDIPVELGLRPYRVFLVHGAWTGGERGAGELVVSARREILPVPRVRDMSAVKRGVRATGVTEDGDIAIDRVSAKYTEDDLMGRTPDLRDPNVARTNRNPTEFWYEIQESRPSSPVPVTRRFSPPAAVPMLSRSGVQWRPLILTKQDEDRSRRGSTESEDP
jgi:hypothetical protein